MNEYSYQDLLSAATRPDATQEDINALGEWFQRYGMCDWNGLAFKVDEKNDIWLAPLVVEVGDDEYERVGFTFARESQIIPGGQKVCVAKPTRTIYRLYKAHAELSKRNLKELSLGIGYMQDAFPVAIKDFDTVEEGLNALQKLESKVWTWERFDGRTLYEIDEYYLLEVKVDEDGDVEYGDCVDVSSMPITVSAIHNDGETVWTFPAHYADINAARRASRGLPREDGDDNSLLYAINVCGCKVWEG